MVREEMGEGSDLFSIHAYLPAQASFGFANDMRRQSSGNQFLVIDRWRKRLTRACCPVNPSLYCSVSFLLSGLRKPHVACCMSPHSVVQLSHIGDTARHMPAVLIMQWVINSTQGTATITLFVLCRCCFSFPDAFSLGASADRSILCASH